MDMRKKIMAAGALIVQDIEGSYAVAGAEEVLKKVVELLDADGYVCDNDGMFGGFEGPLKSIMVCDEQMGKGYLKIDTDMSIPAGEEAPESRVFDQVTGAVQNLVEQMILGIMGGMEE